MRTRTWMTATLAATLLATSLTGCDSDDSSGGTTPAADTTSTADAATGGDTASAPKTIVEIAVGNPDFSTLVAAVQAAGLAETLSSAGPFTVFAPTNAAFAKIPKADLDALLADKAKLTAVLTHHAIAGKIEAKDVATGIVTLLDGTDAKITKDAMGVTIGGAKVTTADIQASNGVIHVIDTVILPPADIVDTAVGAKPEFETLVAAVTAAELVTTLKGKGPFTVFAPTDAAFAKIAKMDLDAILADKALLTSILTYHVVSGKVYAKDVKAGKVKTVQGAELTITTDGGVKVDGAAVTATDIIAANGVIHVIDSVIQPPAK